MLSRSSFLFGSGDFFDFTLPLLLSSLILGTSRLSTGSSSSICDANLDESHDRRFSDSLLPGFSVDFDLLPNNFDSHSSCGFGSTRGDFVTPKLTGSVCRRTFATGELRSVSVGVGVLFSCGDVVVVVIAFWLSELAELLCDKSSNCKASKETK